MSSPPNGPTETGNAEGRLSNNLNMESAGVNLSPGLASRVGVMVDNGVIGAGLTRWEEEGELCCVS
jgi:hypothetical protein